MRPLAGGDAEVESGEKCLLVCFDDAVLDLASPATASPDQAIVNYNQHKRVVPCWKLYLCEP